MIRFLSCDWGTSSFRLTLAEAAALRIVASESTNDGISATFSLWKQSGKERLPFYLAIIGKHIRRMEHKLGCSLAGTPLIISGMASSSIGMLELPYGRLPFRADGSGIITRFPEAPPHFEHPVLLISGVSSDDDVMRGE